MLVEGVLCGPTIVIPTPLTVVGLSGTGRTLSLAAVDCLTLLCSGPCSSCRPGIVSSCIGAAVEL